MGGTRETIQLTIIIPTRNRAAMLKDTLNSLFTAIAGQNDWVECIVIDNGSTDDTRAIVDAFSTSSSFCVRYVYEPCPGLHVGRNLGATLARSEILAYLDDDVLVQPGWAEALIARFNDDPAIMIAGGPCLPHWEATPPGWIYSFQTSLPNNGWVLVQLSLIYLGNAPMPIPGNYVFGCNFAIRKHFVIESGGFHPDGMPLRLLRFRGDGESEMGGKVDAHPHYTAYYDPMIAVLHRVPASRLTKEYFTGIAKRNGIGMGYSLYRSSHASVWSLFVQSLRLTRSALRASRKSLKSRLKKMLRFHTADNSPISEQALAAILAWQAYRQYIRICFSPVLRSWVTQSSYLPGTPCPYYSKRSLHTDKTEQIVHGSMSLAIIIRASFQADGIHFLTPDSFSQQLGYMKRPAGYTIAPHDHNPVERVIEWTQEVLFIRNGKVRLDLYAPKSRDYLESRILEAGDVVLLAHGGHGLVMLEESEIIEVKQGPYTGEADKTRFSQVDSTRIVYGENK